MEELPKFQKEEPMEEKGESDLERGYDREAWEKAKEIGVAWAIQTGRKLGVPEEELDRFVVEAINERRKNGDWGSVFHLMKHLGIGSPEELQEAGEKAYQIFFELKDFDSAEDIAMLVFGEDSEERKLAAQAYTEREKQYWTVSLPSSATLEELIRLVEKIERENGENSLCDVEQWWDSLPPDILDKFFGVEDTSIRLVDFFRNNGYEIPESIPIKFKPQKNLS